MCPCMRCKGTCVCIHGSQHFPSTIPIRSRSACLGLLGHQHNQWSGMDDRLDERMFGAIIRSMLDIARNSENHTWFLEKKTSHRASSPPTIGNAFSVTWHGWPPSTLHCTSSRSSRCRRPIGGMPMIMRPPSTAIFCTFSMKNLGRYQTTKSHLTHLGGRKSTGMRHFS